jgi:hypothetical protein
MQSNPQQPKIQRPRSANEGRNGPPPERRGFEWSSHVAEAVTITATSPKGKGVVTHGLKTVK